MAKDIKEEIKDYFDSTKSASSSTVNPSAKDIINSVADKKNSVDTYKDIYEDITGKSGSNFQTLPYIPDQANSKAETLPYTVDKNGVTNTINNYKTELLNDVSTGSASNAITSKIGSTVIPSSAATTSTTATNTVTGNLSDFEVTGKNIEDEILDNQTLEKNDEVQTLSDNLQATSDADSNNISSGFISQELLSSNELEEKQTLTDSLSSSIDSEIFFDSSTATNEFDSITDKVEVLMDKNAKLNSLLNDINDYWGGSSKDIFVTNAQSYIETINKYLNYIDTKRVGLTNANKAYSKLDETFNEKEI